MAGPKDWTYTNGRLFPNFQLLWPRTLIHTFRFKWTQSVPSIMSLWIPDSYIFSQLPATDFGAFVINILSHASSRSDTIDQKVLRRCIQLASSFLVTDTTTNPERGISTWSLGFCRLVDLVVVLHTRNELELETVSAASKACSECWTAAGNWPGLNECRNRVRDIGGRLKKVLDSNERTYRGTWFLFLFSSFFSFRS